VLPPWTPRVPRSPTVEMSRRPPARPGCRPLRAEPRAPLVSRCSVNLIVNALGPQTRRGPRKVVVTRPLVTRDRPGPCTVTPCGSAPTTARALPAEAVARAARHRRRPASATRGWPTTVLPQGHTIPAGGGGGAGAGLGLSIASGIVGPPTAAALELSPRSAAPCFPGYPARENPVISPPESGPPPQIRRNMRRPGGREPTKWVKAR